MRGWLCCYSFCFFFFGGTGCHFPLFFFGNWGTGETAGGGIINNGSEVSAKGGGSWSAPFAWKGHPEHGGNNVGSIWVLGHRMTLDGRGGRWEYDTLRCALTVECYSKESTYVLMPSFSVGQLRCARLKDVLPSMHSSINNPLAYTTLYTALTKPIRKHITTAHTTKAEQSSDHLLIDPRPNPTYITKQTNPACQLLSF